MSFKRVEPAQAVEWIRGAVRLILANPAPFLLMGLAMTMIAVVPFLGALALLIIGPVLYAGLLTAARSQAEGGQADFNQLLEGFRQPGKVGPLIALCLPSVAFMFAVFIAMVLVALSFGAAALMAGGSETIDPTQINFVTLFGAGGLVVLVIVLVPLALATAALLFFALPRVMFDGIEPFAALRESAQATVANLGAFLVTVLTLFFARFAAAVILGSLIPFLGVLLVGTVFTPLIAAVLYVAWRDVFGAAATGPATEDAPPPPPEVIEV
jgi:hypothetical protein